MKTLLVVNLKCGGCAKTITKELEQLGCIHITVSPDTQKISYSLQKDSKTSHAEIIETLENLGYPLQESKKAKSLLKKAKSYASCAVGKFL